MLQLQVRNYFCYFYKGPFLLVLKQYAVTRMVGFFKTKGEILIPVIVFNARRFLRWAPQHELNCQN